MQFNSFLYILVFLPLTLIGWFFLSRFSQMAARLFLVAASLFFYWYAGPTCLQWLLISMVFNYFIVCLLKKNKYRWLLVIGIAGNVCLLLYFKYTNFFIRTINQLFHDQLAPLDLVLPIGISFFTFQQISYLVDSYRDETKENSLLDYILYVVYFPKILMGPIVQQSDLIPQFHSAAIGKPSSANIIRGIQMFTLGLFKKVVIADTFAKSVAWLFQAGNLEKATSIDCLLVMVAYTFQIYFDFSGYSDMATGAAWMMNIRLPINFDSPYKAYSIRDFWKRWHISLTRFLTGYIYIPLGGSWQGLTRTCLNTMIVFLVSGFWHGANWTFVLWGILHGAFSVFDRLTDKWRVTVHPALQWLFTFAAVNILWLLFRADSISQWLHILRRIFSFKNAVVTPGLINSFALPGGKGLAMVIAFYGVSLLLCLGVQNAYRRKYTVTMGTAVLSAGLFIFALTYLGTEAVFVYFNF